MFLEIATHAAITGAFEAYGHRHELKTQWNRISYQLKHGKLSILIIGPGGAGKSTLSQFICDPSTKTPPNKYKESLQIERLDLPGLATADLITAPGQERHTSSWDDLFEELKSPKKRFGIINVVAYGYHSTILEIENLRKSQQTTKSATNQYLGKGRVREIDIARQLAERLKRHNKPFWMVTLATKQDLWWHERSKIQKHYMSGDYAKEIDRIRTEHTASGFRHEFFSMAVHSQNFADEGGSIIQPTAAGYDDIIKYAHQKRFLEILWSFIDPSAINK